MSMDDTLAALRAFEADLDRLNEALAASVDGLRREHDHLDGLWNDDFARLYRRRWDTFEHHMEHYLRREAPRYGAFLRERIAHLRRYLSDD